MPAKVYLPDREIHDSLRTELERQLTALLYFISYSRDIESYTGYETITVSFVIDPHKLKTKDEKHACPANRP